jgi:hypothetical protein
MKVDRDISGTRLAIPLEIIWTNEWQPHTHVSARLAQPFLNESPARVCDLLCREQHPTLVFEGVSLLAYGCKLNHIQLEENRTKSLMYLSQYEVDAGYETLDLKSTVGMVVRYQRDVYMASLWKTVLAEA